MEILYPQMQTQLTQRAVPAIDTDSATAAISATDWDTTGPYRTSMKLIPTSQIYF